MHILKFCLEERTAHVVRIVQLAGAVVVEYLREDARMPVEEVLVEYGVVVSERLGEATQSTGRYLLQRCLVRLEPLAAHVQSYLLRVHAHLSACVCVCVCVSVCVYADIDVKS